MPSSQQDPVSEKSEVGDGESRSREVERGVEYSEEEEELSDQAGVPLDDVESVDEDAIPRRKIEIDNKARSYPS
jgi:rRNA-processing protein EBP2